MNQVAGGSGIIVDMPNTKGGLLDSGRFDPEYLGRLLKTEREKRFLSLEEVERDLGIPKTNIWRIENARIEEPRFSDIVRLAWYYKLNISDVVSVTGLKARDMATAVDAIDDPRLRVAVDHILSENDAAWKEQIVTMLYMFVMSKTDTP